jgi:ankyrin repeat protein
MKDNEKKLIQAAKNGNFAECQRLLTQHQMDVNAKDDDHEIGWSPLLLAARSGHLDLVRLLLKHGAEVNAKSKSEQTPLHGACWNGHASVAKLLCDHGANSNAKNRFGQTPLHWAAHYGHADVVRVLLAEGALVKARNEDGETPLDKAQSSVLKSAGRTAVIQLLQRSQTTLKFFAIIFAKKDELPFHEWHERMISVMEDMHDMRIYYTLLRCSLANRMILKRQAESLLERALERSSTLSSNSEQAYEMWRTLLAKSLHDELIDESLYNRFDGYDRSLRFGGKMDVPFASLRSCIHQRTSQINGLEGITRSLQRTIQALVRKLQELRNEQQATSDTRSKNHAHSKNPSNSKRFRVKLDALVAIVGSIVNAFGMPNCSPLQEKIISRMVDFADLDHMRHAILTQTDTDDPTTTSSKRYLQAFEEGVALSVECAKSPSLVGPLSPRIDEAVRRKDPLLILGLVAGLADPPAVEAPAPATAQPQEREEVRKPEAQPQQPQQGSVGHKKHPHYYHKHKRGNSAGHRHRSPSPSLASTYPSTAPTSPSFLSTTHSFSTGPRLLPTAGFFKKDDADSAPPLQDVSGVQAGGGDSTVSRLDAVSLQTEEPTQNKNVSTTTIFDSAMHTAKNPPPPIKHFEMPRSGSAVNSLSESSRAYDLSESSRAYEDASEAFSQKQQLPLTEIYPDAILVEEDEEELELHAAVKYGDKELLREALQQVLPSDVNAKDSNGRTALDLAALTGQLGLIVLLKEQGGQFEIKSGARMRAIARKRSEQVATYLRLVESELD